MEERKNRTKVESACALALCFVLLAIGCIALTFGNQAFAEGKDEEPDQAIRITKGPVIEFVSDHSAVIAWSTNVNSATVLHYGTSDHKLTERAESNYRGRTHRVHLLDLRPNTTYYFQVESPHAQGTGNTEDRVESFHTPPKGQKVQRYSGGY
jgi:hypothetical protein